MYNTTDASTIIITTPDGKYLLQQRDDNPNIEFPGFNSLIAGYIKDKETPLEAAVREVHEEIINTRDGKLKISSPAYLGSIKRFDYDRNDYVHHALLFDSIEDIAITEGKGLILCTLEECRRMKNIAPHHKYYIERYASVINKEPLPVTAVGHKQVQIEDLVKLYELNCGKDIEKLENGLGFYEGEGQSSTELIHFDDDIKFVGYLRFQPNAPRGNHYHLRKVEYMAILDGELKTELRLYNNESDKIEIIWKRGQIMRLLPGAIHTITATSINAATAIEFSPQRFKASDVYKL